MRAALLLALLLAPGLPSSTAFADDGGGGDPAGEPVQSLRADIEACSKLLRYPLATLSDRQLQRVLDGGVARLRTAPESGEGAHTVLGALRTDLHRDRAYLGAMLPEFETLDELTEVRVSQPGERPTLWYQHARTPWPLAPRHWLLRTGETPSTAEQSDGRCWEHWWEGAEASAEQMAAWAKSKGLTEADLKGVIVPPENRGAWVFVQRADGSTVVLYHLALDPGGTIPDRLIAEYAKSTLGKALRAAIERGRTVVDGAYTAERMQRDPVWGGDGKPVPVPPPLKP